MAAVSSMRLLVGPSRRPTAPSRAGLEVQDAPQPPGGLATLRLASEYLDGLQAGESLWDIRSALARTGFFFQFGVIRRMPCVRLMARSNRRRRRS